MSTIAFLRADTDTRLSASDHDEILDRYPTNCQVEVLEEQGDWVKIKPVRLKRTTSGFVPRLALILPPEPRLEVFPLLPSGNKGFPSVPPQLKLSEFLLWMSNGGQPAWFREADWTAFSPSQQETLRDAILHSTQAEAARWDVWLAQVDAAGRQDEAVMDEWVVTLQGGRDVYAIRDHYIYKDAVQDVNYWGCALKGQIMRWSGEVKSSQGGTTRRQLYHVQFYRMHQEMTGWFRGDLTQEYIFPTDSNDPEIAANAENVFDLTTPILRHPRDHEINDSINAHFTGAQYIDIRDVIGKSLRHFCLCGEFCIAALAKKDVIPLLLEWYNANPKYWRVVAILTNPHEGTSIGDLKSLLAIENIRAGDPYSSTPGTPTQFKEYLDSGRFAISGCGINSAGKVKADGTIRHWVVLEDVLPVGNNGWVRIYNPFHNREEVYDYNTFMTSVGIGMGLWIDLGRD